MKRIFLPLFLLALLLPTVACGSEALAKYSVTYQAQPEQDGLTAYIIDYDTGDKIDSTLVANGLIKMEGMVGEPRLARLIIDGNRAGVFILEKGDVTVLPAERIGAGTPLNEAFKHYVSVCDSIENVYGNTPADSAGSVRREQLVKEYEIYNNTMLEGNADNPIGYYIFLQQAYEMDLNQLEAALQKMPGFAQMRRVKDLQASLQTAAASGIGSQFKDFEVTYNDSTYRLSDYVGVDGKYLLVDFWASWCGPCIKETRVIKELYKRFGSKGLNVLGVAVWDEPQNTERGIKTHQLPWPQIINAQKIPTDLYGISGIPHIMIIDPQGKIVSRGLQGQELINEVERLMGEASNAADGDE